MDILSFNILGVDRLIEFFLRVRLSKRIPLAKQRSSFAEFYTPNHIYVYLFNLKKPFRFHKFLHSFNGLINHEMGHYFLKEFRGYRRVKEKICRKMELNKIE